MKRDITEKLSDTPASRLLCALVLNALFLAALLALMPPAFEANDDLALAAFADGQMAEKCTYIPYINYVLALILNGAYRLLGEGMAWHTIGQYALLFAGFTAVSRVLYERLGFRQATLVSIILLLFFGTDCYMIISYTKTAGVCAVAGTALLFMSTETVPPGRRLLPAAAGIILCAFGFMLRKMEFLPCAAIMAALGFRRLYGLVFFEKELCAGERLRVFGRFVLPFLLMLAVTAGLFGADKLAWSRSPWREWLEFDNARVAYSDYGRPEYEQMPEAYEALGLSESSVELLNDGDYFDTEVFTAELMESISEARQENISAPSLGECLGIFLDKCLVGFFINLHVYGFLLIMALWLCAGEHDLRGWLSLGCICGLFVLFYIYLIYRGRYLVDRVDVGLFFAMSVAAAYMLRPERLSRERVVSLAALGIALGAWFWLCRGSFRSAERPELSREREAVETILADEEHIYLAKLDTVNDTLYPPFTPAPAGYGDRIILLGGWDCGHPAIMQALSRGGISNPYRDLVNNPQAYIIDEKIELTLEHIHEFYDEDAYAELVEPLSTETGLNIYRILSEGGASR